MRVDVYNDSDSDSSDGCTDAPRFSGHRSGSSIAEATSWIVSVHLHRVSCVTCCMSCAVFCHDTYSPDGGSNPSRGHNLIGVSHSGGIEKCRREKSLRTMCEASESSDCSAI